MTDLTVVMHHYVRQFFESKFVSIKGLELGRFVASIGVTNKAPYQILFKDKLFALPRLDINDFSK